MQLLSLILVELFVDVFHCEVDVDEAKLGLKLNFTLLLPLSLLGRLPLSLLRNHSRGVGKVAEVELVMLGEFLAQGLESGVGVETADQALGGVFELIAVYFFTGGCLSGGEEVLPLLGRLVNIFCQLPVLETAFVGVGGRGGDLSEHVKRLLVGDDSPIEHLHLTLT